MDKRYPSVRPAETANELSVSLGVYLSVLEGLFGVDLGEALRGDALVDAVHVLIHRKLLALDMLALALLLPPLPIHSTVVVPTHGGCLRAISQTEKNQQ